MEPAMTLKLTRKELYDLIWDKPRTEIAKDLQISDVRLGKLCREMNVPAPPRGYWANLAGKRRKRKFVKPPLDYTLAERIEEDHDAVWLSFPKFDPKDFDQPVPPPPVFSYSVEEALERYRLLVDKVPMPKSTRGLHPITQKFIAEDERLAKVAKSYSWHKPKYQSPEGQELLQGMSQLLWMWADLGFKPSSSGHRHIRLWVGHKGWGRSFEVTRTEATPAPSHRVAKGKPAGFEFRFGTETWERQSKKPDLIFPEFTRTVLRNIALLAIEQWEKGFRDAVKRNYDWRLHDRKQAIEEYEKACESERKRKASELQALLDSRQKLLNDAISNVARSDQIRALIGALDERIGSQSNEVPAFQHWRSWALSQAAAIDPRARSLTHLNEWFEKFRLNR